MGLQTYVYFPPKLSVGKKNGEPNKYITKHRAAGYWYQYIRGTRQLTMLKKKYIPTMNQGKYIFHLSTHLFYLAPK